MASTDICYQTNDDDEWTVVAPRTKIHQESFKKVILTQQNIIAIIRECASDYSDYIRTIILHGSTGLNRHTESSDVDIAIVWKCMQFDHMMEEIYGKLQNKLKKQVDITNFIFAETNYKSLTKRFVHNLTEQNQNFVELVKEKGLVITGSTNDIDLSVYALHKYN